MPQLSDKEKTYLINIAADLRIAVVGMIGEAQSGHPAGALGTADIIAVLFFHSMQAEDAFLLSNGHICTVLYAALAMKGEIPWEYLRNFRKINSPLQGHPHNLSLPQVLISSGPLGQGLSQTAGIAIAHKMNNSKAHIFCMTSDAELQEGQTWEAAMLIGAKKLPNVTWIIDRNNIQISGNTEDVLPIENLRNKLEAFNWKVLETDGHSLENISTSFEESRKGNLPTAIIANTIPGKGVKFMEYKFEWHGKSPTKDEVIKAVSELEGQKVQVLK